MPNGHFINLKFRMMMYQFYLTIFFSSPGLPILLSNLQLLNLENVFDFSFWSPLHLSIKKSSWLILPLQDRIKAYTEISASCHWHGSLHLGPYYWKILLVSVLSLVLLNLYFQIKIQLCQFCLNFFNELLLLLS